MNRILITGGAGFIGSTLCEKLLNNNFEVTILDNLSPQIHGNDPDKTSPLYRKVKQKVNFIHGSVTSRADLEKALANQDAVVHFAAETGTGQSMYKIAHYVDVNIGGTALMLDILANTKHRVKKIVVASSRSIYGEGRYFSKELNTYVYPSHRLSKDMDKKDFEVKYPGCQEPLELVATDEDSKIHPSSVYGITKQNQEQLIMTVCPTIGIAPVAFRYQNVYGPGQSLTNPYTGILSIFSSLIKQGKKINVFEDGLESRDFVFIDDVVEATFLGITNNSANDQIFNVGTCVPINVLTVVQTLIKSYSTDVPFEISGNYRLGDIRHNFADLTKINNLLGFKPRFTFEQGMKKFTDWVNTQEIEQSKYDESIIEMSKKGLLK
jgi:dTDP-L-rhamnose 4-epimerase